MKIENLNSATLTEWFGDETEIVPCGSADGCEFYRVVETGVIFYDCNGDPGTEDENGFWDIYRETEDGQIVEDEEAKAQRAQDELDYQERAQREMEEKEKESEKALEKTRVPVQKWKLVKKLNLDYTERMPAEKPIDFAFFDTEEEARKALEECQSRREPLAHGECAQPDYHIEPVTLYRYP
jgi:hypothetical protein